jgi:hypothetical protein
VVLPVARIGAISANIAAWVSVTTAPARASVAAGAVSAASGIVPNRSTAAARPAGSPYTPQEAAPAPKTWTASPKETSTSSSGARSARSAPLPGAVTKKSSRVGSPPGGATMR